MQWLKRMLLLAAVRRTDDDLAGLRAAFETMAASRETRRFRAADSAFHQGIAAAARNDWMERSIEDARAFLWMTVDKVAGNVFRTAQLHHGQILAAIEQGDPDAAERYVAAHIELTRTDLMRIADRHNIIQRGRVVWQGTTAELQADDAARERYLGL